MAVILMSCHECILATMGLYNSTTIKINLETVIIIYSVKKYYFEANFRIGDTILTIKCVCLTPSMITLEISPSLQY